VRAAIYTVLAGVVTLVFVGAVIFGSGRGLTRHERASVPHLSPSAIATDDRTE
jgi:ABC-type lipoprotein release transport system permease subunit